MLSGDPTRSVEPISDRLWNPFGMHPPCADGRAVPGYGDPAADFHVIGDHPARHGGETTGVPFTGSVSGTRLQQVLSELGFLKAAYADEPTVENLFLSYLHLCTPETNEEPIEASYARLERFFDAELRAVNAHVLLPVGTRATDRVLSEYTTQFEKVPTRMEDRHAMEIRGRGFLVVPMKSPDAWDEADQTHLHDRLAQLLASDYRQTKGVATLIG